MSSDVNTTDRARVLLELVEDCLRNGKRDVAVEQLAKAFAEERKDEIDKLSVGVDRLVRVFEERARALGIDV